MRQISVFDVLRATTAFFLFAGSLILATQASAATVNEVVGQAQQALAGDDANAALAALQPHEMEFAGNVDFDYWLGLAAVRAGKPEAAIFPLERVIAQQPKHAAARMELAAAYIQMGQRENAAMELEKLEQMNPPPAAAERIEQMNKAVSRQASNEKYKNRVAFLSLEYGTDDNVGTWPEGDLSFGSITLPVEPIDSGFYALQGGYWQKFGINATNSIALSLNGMARRNQEDEAEQFDQDYLSAKGEWEKDLNGRHAVAMAIETAGMNLDGEEFYRLLGVYGEWRNAISRERRYYARLAFRDIGFEPDINDYRQIRVKTGSTYVVGRSRIGVDLNIDSESAVNDRPGGDALVYGIYGNYSYQFTGRQRTGISAYYNKANYDAPVNVGEDDRSDDRLGAGVWWEYFMTSNFQVRLRADYRDQDSNVETYTYDQTSASLAGSYYF